MKTSIVSNKDLSVRPLRLDCGPYVNDSFLMKKALRKSSLVLEQLQNVTLDALQGIFKAPRLSPKYVIDKKVGTPYLSSSEILEKNYLDVKAISVEQANLNNKFKVRHGMTLITSSGTIGRTNFASQEIDSWMGSPHFMRVMPDARKIPAGYLYAFLSSRYGNAQIKEGIYGSIIVAIEPEHIASILIPRVGTIEKTIDTLILDASRARQEANMLLKEAVFLYEKEHGLKELERLQSGYSYSISETSSLTIQRRFDARFHNKFHQEVVKELKESRSEIRLAEFSSRIFEPNRFKRIQADSGIKLYGTTAIFQNTPDHNCYISQSIKNVEQYIVSGNMLLVPRSGQLNGVIGNVEICTGALLGHAVSEDAIRIECDSEDKAAYAYVALSSEYSRRQLKSRAFGTSIPHLDVRNIGDVLILFNDNAKFKKVSDYGKKISELRNRAFDLEMKAISMVEELIEASVSGS